MLLVLLFVIEFFEFKPWWFSCWLAILLTGLVIDDETAPSPEVFEVTPGTSLCIILIHHF